MVATIDANAATNSTELFKNNFPSPLPAALVRATKANSALATLPARPRPLKYGLFPPAIAYKLEKARTASFAAFVISP